MARLQLVLPAQDGCYPYMLREPGIDIKTCAGHYLLSLVRGLPASSAISTCRSHRPVRATASIILDRGRLEDYLESKEKKAIIDALNKNRWNRTTAAKHLGLTFRQLRYRLKKLELE